MLGTFIGVTVNIRPVALRAFGGEGKIRPRLVAEPPYLVAFSVGDDPTLLLGFDHGV